MFLWCSFVQNFTGMCGQILYLHSVVESAYMWIVGSLVQIFFFASRTREYRQFTALLFTRWVSLPSRLYFPFRVWAVGFLFNSGILTLPAVLPIVSDLFGRRCTASSGKRRPLSEFLCLQKPERSWIGTCSRLFQFDTVSVPLCCMQLAYSTNWKMLAASRISLRCNLLCFYSKVCNQKKKIRAWCVLVILGGSLFDISMRKSHCNNCIISFRKKNLDKDETSCPSWVRLWDSSLAARQPRESGRTCMEQSTRL